MVVTACATTGCMICHNFSMHTYGACTTTIWTVLFRELRFLQQINMPLQYWTLPYSHLKTDNSWQELQANHTTSSASRRRLPCRCQGNYQALPFTTTKCLLCLHGEKLELTRTIVHHKYSYNKSPPNIWTMESGNRATMSSKFMFQVSFKRPMKAQFTS